MRIIKVSMVLATMLLAGAVAFAQPADDAAATPAHRAHAPKAHVLTRAEIDSLLAEPRRVLFIDVRRPDEISSLGGFPVYLSIQIKDLKNSLAWIPRDRTLVTVSNHAARAGQAAALLSAHGFKVAGAAGVELYAKEGGVLTKVAIPPPRKTGNPAAAQ